MGSDFCIFTLFRNHLLLSKKVDFTVENICRYLNTFYKFSIIIILFILKTYFNTLVR